MPTESVLVVDDDVDLGDTLEAILRSEGFGTGVARTRETALAAAAQVAPRVALVDLRLGQESGLELIGALRQRLPNLVVVVMTAYPEVDAAVAALKHGAHDFLRKPVHPAVLVATVRRALAHAQMLDERDASHVALEASVAELRAANARLRRLSESMRRLASFIPFDDFLAALLEEFAANMAAEGGSLYVLQGDALRLMARVGSGRQPERLAWPPEEDSVMGRAAGHGEVLVVPNIAEAALRQSGGEYVNGSLLVAPLRAPQGPGIAGVVTLHNKLRPPFTEQDADIAGTLAAFGYERLCSQQVTAVLEQREQQYYLLERNIQDAFWLTDATGYFTYVSPSSGALLGLAPEALPGRHALETVAPAHRRAALRVLIEARREGCAAQGGVQQVVELRHRNGTGEDRWLETRVGPLRDAAGQLQGYVGVSRDITDRKRLELEAQRRAQHLLQADKLVSLGTLVGGIAHEINNANHLIMASTALLEQGWPEFQSLLGEALGQRASSGADVTQLREIADDTPVLIEHIAGGASRIKRIVSDLRDFARGDTARLDQRVDLGVVAEQSLRIVGGVLNKSSIQVRKQLRADLPPARGNMVRLEQVVIHLLQNAIQSMETAGGELSIETGLDAARGAVVLEVRDRGCGIPEEALRQVFDPFFTTKRELGCAGLGLSVSSAIVQQHMGQLDVENRPDGGVCARLSLPVGGSSGSD